MRAPTARLSFLARFALPLAAAFVFGLLPVSAEAYGGQPLSPAGGLSNGQTTYTWSEASGASEYLIAVDTAWGEIRFRHGSRSGAVCGGGTCSATPWQTLELGQ